MLTGQLTSARGLADRLLELSKYRGATRAGRAQRSWVENWIRAELGEDVLGERL